MQYSHSTLRGDTQLTASENCRRLRISTARKEYVKKWQEEERAERSWMSISTGPSHIISYWKTALTPCPDIWKRQAAAEDVLDQHEQAAVRTDQDGRCVMLVYFAADTEEKIRLGDLFGSAVYGAWFDPKDGSLTDPEDLYPLVEEGVLAVKNESTDRQDRVLILTQKKEDITVPSRSYGKEQTSDDIRKVFEW